MPLNWTISGPANLPGKLYVAALGSAVTFSTWNSPNYTGLMIANPPTLPGQLQVRIVPLRCTFVPTGTGGTGGPYLQAGPVAIGLIKGIGTCVAGQFSAFSGIITSKGIAGTSTSQIAVVAGTASWLNGTAGPGNNCPNWIQMLGSVTSQVGAATNAVIPGAPCLYDLQSEEGIMPGEALGIATSIQIAGFASIAWVEVPANSGA
jgi:hypothetical protein